MGLPARFWLALASLCLTHTALAADPAESTQAKETDGSVSATIESSEPQQVEPKKIEPQQLPSVSAKDAMGDEERKTLEPGPTVTDLRVAAERFDEGRSSFRVGAFAEAAEHFEAADARAPSAPALGLAMRSRLEAGQFAKAATLAELVLLRHPENQELATQAKAIIDARRGEFGRLEISCKVRCELIIDKKLVHGRAMLLWRIHTEAGSHSIVANFEDGSVLSTSADSVLGEDTSVQLEPPAKPTTVALPPVVAKVDPTPAPEPQQLRLPPLYFWIGVGATSVLTAGTVWSGIDTLNNPGKDAVRAACAGQDSSCALYQEGQSKELRTNILLGSAIVVGVATAVTGLFFTDFGAPGAAPQRGSVTKWSVRPVAELHPQATGGLHGLIGAEGRF